MPEAAPTVAVAAGLIGDQFPQWADLAIRPVAHAGWDNTTFRLGDELSIRLPNHDALVAQVEKEQRWLPVLARHLPLPIPAPVARGAPGRGFPRPWSVHRWLDGEPVGRGSPRDLDRLAEDLAGFLAALQRVPAAGGPLPGVHSYHRGGPLAVVDDAARAAIDRLDGRIDTAGALAVWDAALASAWDGPDVWVHGDVTGSNLLVHHDRLSGVIDFGCAAVGDPACDLAVAWTTFAGSSRHRFRRAVAVDGETWARARGWALWKAVKALPTLPEDHPRNDGTRLGWRRAARAVVDQVVTDHRASG